VGFSLGFERLVELVEIDADSKDASVAVIFDQSLEPKQLIETKRELLAEGLRVRLVRKTKNTRAILDQLQKDGFKRYSFLNPGEPLDWKNLD
jgi:histidyl-tRNA synthetase